MTTPTPTPDESPQTTPSKSKRTYLCFDRSRESVYLATSLLCSLQDRPGASLEAVYALLEQANEAITSELDPERQEALRPLCVRKTMTNPKGLNPDNFVGMALELEGRDMLTYTHRAEGAVVSLTVTPPETHRLYRIRTDQLLWLEAVLTNPAPAYESVRTMIKGIHV